MGDSSSRQSAAILQKLANHPRAEEAFALLGVRPDTLKRWKAGNFDRRLEWTEVRRRSFICAKRREHHR